MLRRCISRRALCSPTLSNLLKNNVLFASFRKSDLVARLCAYLFQVLQEEVDVLVGHVPHENQAQRTVRLAGHGYVPVPPHQLLPHPRRIRHLQGNNVHDWLDKGLDADPACAGDEMPRQLHAVADDLPEAAPA